MKMTGLNNRAVVAPPAALAAAGLGLIGQALFAAHRPLPEFDHMDCSGWEGTPSSRVRRIVALGDSTLTGPGLDRVEQIWLRQAMRQIAGHRQLEMISVAVGGSRAHDVLVRQVPLLHVPATSFGDDPIDVAVLSVGGNDAIRQTSLRSFRSDIHGVLVAMGTAALSVVVCGLPDLGLIPRAPHPLAVVLSARSRRFNRVLLEESRATGARFVPGWCATEALVDTTENFAPDLFHLSAAGHRRVSRIAAPIIAESLARARTLT
jgi:lysophospholipase L1-like esterase